MTLVNAETGELIAECSTDEARELTDRIRTAVSVAWELVAEAYNRQAHRALGYSSWDAYVAAEFGSARLRLPREERQEVVGSLREQGLSIRAIAAATGVGRDAVSRDLSAVRNRTPDPEPEVEPRFKGSPAPKPAPPKPITGLDGKSYTPKPKPKPAPLTPEQQRAADIEAANKRAARYLEQLTDVWPYFRSWLRRDAPAELGRDAVAEYLTVPTAAALAEIEREIKEFR